VARQNPINARKGITTSIIRFDEAAGDLSQNPINARKGITTGTDAMRVALH